MDIGPQEKFRKFREMSENHALKQFPRFFVQPTASGSRKILMKVKFKY